MHIDPLLPSTSSLIMTINSTQLTPESISKMLETILSEKNPYVRRTLTAYLSDYDPSSLPQAASSLVQALQTDNYLYVNLSFLIPIFFDESDDRWIDSNLFFSLSYLSAGYERM